MIAVADSGIGGLNILKKLTEAYSNADFTYFADNDYAPYGRLSKEMLEERVFTVTEALFLRGAGHVVWACNTASTNCLTRLKSIYGYKISGIMPTLKDCSEKSVIMCTPLTATSAAVSAYASSGVRVIVDANLAELIEANRFNIDALRGYLSELLCDCGAERVVLGCTHYSYIKELVEEITGAVTDDCSDDVLASVGRSLRPCDVVGSGKIEFLFSGKDEKEDYLRLLGM